MRGAAPFWLEGVPAIMVPKVVQTIKAQLQFQEVFILSESWEPTFSAHVVAPWFSVKVPTAAKVEAITSAIPKSFRSRILALVNMQSLDSLLMIG
jgi:hypothetical protein